MNYKYLRSESFWFFMSLIWQILWGFIISIFKLYDNLFLGIFLIGTAYTLYYTLKTIVYAWIINPIRSFKNNRKSND